MKNTKSLAGRTRTYRRLHKWVALPLCVFLFIIGLTGILLGWKKQANLRPPTRSGTTSDARQWISIDSLQKVAWIYVKDSLNLDPAIDRIDIRPDKGIAKVVFANHYTEIQLDCASAQILGVDKRYNDLIEHIHDGTIIDRWLQTRDEQAKIFYTTLTSLGLMVLAFTGFWLWYNPKRIRQLKQTGTDNLSQDNE